MLARPNATMGTHCIEKFKRGVSIDFPSQWRSEPLGMLGGTTFYARRQAKGGKAAVMPTVTNFEEKVALTVQAIPQRKTFPSTWKASGKARR
jgi:hypothetical protein